MAEHLETETKFDADAGFALPGLDSAGPGGRRAAQPRKIYLAATYFDTEDLDLVRHKITLRRRVGGDDEGWHLKLPVRKDTRQEVRVPLGDSAADTVPARLAAQVADIVAGRPLRPVAIVDTERTVVTVAARDGDALVEVADDRVTATRLAGARGTPMTWREVEVEALSPGPATAALLEEVGAVLREAGARPSSSPSKLARVLGTG